MKDYEFLSIYWNYLLNILELFLQSHHVIITNSSNLPPLSDNVYRPPFAGTNSKILVKEKVLLKILVTFCINEYSSYLSSNFVQSTGFISRGPLKWCASGYQFKSPNNLWNSSKYECKWIFLQLPHVSHVSNQPAKSFKYFFII